MSNLVDDGTGEPVETQANKIPKTNEKETTIERGSPCDSEIPEWLQEFRETLVGDEIPWQGGSHASSSHETSVEPTTKRRENLGKHSVYTHFPKDRNCEICKRTKITRAPCRRRNGEAVPRAANFGDLITADHKVLIDNCESRNNHRYAVVVQDLATQWIQAYPCKNKTSQETQRSSQKFLEPERKPVNTIHPEPEIHEQIYMTKRLRNNVYNSKHILNNADRNVNKCVNDETHADALICLFTFIPSMHMCLRP